MEEANTYIFKSSNNSESTEKKLDTSSSKSFKYDEKDKTTDNTRLLKTILELRKNLKSQSFLQIVKVCRSGYDILEKW